MPVCQAGRGHQPGFIIRVLTPISRQSWRESAGRGPDSMAAPCSEQGRGHISGPEHRSATVMGRGHLPTRMHLFIYPLPIHSPAILKAPTACQASAEHDKDQTQVLPLLLVSLLSEHTEECGTSGPLYRLFLCWIPLPPDSHLARVSRPGKGQSGPRCSQSSGTGLGSGRMRGWGPRVGEGSLWGAGAGLRGQRWGLGELSRPLTPPSLLPATHVLPDHP